MINNLKKIREIYGSTQEQVAKAIDVNRVTIANWEAGTSLPSSSKQEKLSLYFGIGPEFFLKEELTESAIKLIDETSKKARNILEQSNGSRNKEEDLRTVFDNTTFRDALNSSVFYLKILLAKADDADLDTLKTAARINKKMGDRLNAIVEIREKESSENDPSLFELIGQIEK